MLSLGMGGTMPDQRGRLTPEDFEKIRQWWLTNERWKASVVCPACQTTSWTVLDFVLQLMRHGEDAIVTGTPAYPMIGVICNHCSHTMLFNAVTMGVVGEYDPKVDSTALPSLPPPRGGSDG